MRDRSGRLALRRAARHERDRPGGEREDEEDHRCGEQDAQAPVCTSERGAALLEEVAFEPVEPDGVAAGVGPLEGRCKSCASEEFARLAAGLLPARRRLRQVPVQPAALRVLLDPAGEPLPPLEQRLVHELDRVVAGDEEPPLDERREHARDALVLVGVELCARRSAPGERVAVTARDEPEQDPASERSLGGVERLEGRLRVPADGAADAVRPFVGGLGERRSVALAPEVE